MRTIVISVLILLFALSACATKTALDPAPGTTTFGRGNHQVVDTLSGVELTASADAWRGMPEIVQEIIPIKVTIRNNHGKPITVQHRNFSLVNPNGKRYEARVPEEIKGQVRVASPGLYAGPSFYYNSFNMPPYFGYYPGRAGIVDPFYNDPWFYNRYYGTYSGNPAEVNLPTKDMLSEALPEMTVPQGGEITGFLYFNKIGDEKQVDLNMDVVETGGDRIGTISIPFVVEDKK